MSRHEISGYVQIIIGVVGIVITLLTAPNILDAAGTLAGGRSLPPELSGIGGAIRIFGVVFVLVVLVGLLLTGLAVVLATVARPLGAKHPMLTCSLGVGALLCTAIGITLTAVGTPFWAPILWAAISLMILAIVAALHEEMDFFWGAGALFGGMFVIVSFGAVLANLH